MLIEVANKRFIETKYVSKVYVEGCDFSSEDKSYQSYKTRIYIYAVIADSKSCSVLLEELSRDVDEEIIDKKLNEWVKKINCANNGNTYFSPNELNEIMADVFGKGN